jgi:SpoIID/LytB domain protein
MSRPARRLCPAARIVIVTMAVLAPAVIAAVPSVAAAGPDWPEPTTGATTLTDHIWFRGRGYGHGVGMSQHGARGRALAGQSYVQILAHYYRGTTLGTTDPDRQVRVRVLAGFKPTSSSPFTIVGRRRSFTIDGIDATFPVDSTIRLDRTASGWRLTVKSAAGSELARRESVTTLLVRPASGGRLQVPPRPSSYDTYRGLLRVRAGTSISVVNEIRLDLYLRGVVPAEMPSSWPTEALRAQAIAARSYAVRRLHPTTGSYDLTDDTKTQVYLGIERETAATNQAIADTAGVVVMADSAVANTLFHSTGGAATEHNENAFVASSGSKVAGPVSYLRGRPDLRPDGTSYDDGSPYTYWKTATYSVASLSAIFAADPRTNVGTLVSLDLSARGVSGRLIKVVLAGTAGTRTVSGDVFRAAFNANNGARQPDLRSTLIDLVQDPPRATVAGQATATPFGD